MAQQALGPLPSVNSESAGLRDFKCGLFVGVNAEIERFERLRCSNLWALCGGER